MGKEELKKKLKWLFDEEQQLGINEQDRFHNSEEGKKQYEALFENDPCCNDVKSEENIEELMAKLERYNSQVLGRIREFINRNEALSLNAEEKIAQILDSISILIGSNIVEKNTPTFTELPSKIECSLDGLYIIQVRFENICSRLKQIDLLLKLL